MHITIINLSTASLVKGCTIFAVVILVAIAPFILGTPTKQANGFIDLMRKANDTALQLERNTILMRTSSALMLTKNSLNLGPGLAQLYVPMAIEDLEGLSDGLRKETGGSQSSAIGQVIFAVDTARDLLNKGDLAGAKNALQTLNDQLISIGRH